MTTPCSLSNIVGVAVVPDFIVYSCWPTRIHFNILHYTSKSDHFQSWTLTEQVCWRIFTSKDFILVLSTNRQAGSGTLFSSRRLHVGDSQTLWITLRVSCAFCKNAYIAGYLTQEKRKARAGDIGSFSDFLLWLRFHFLIIGLIVPSRFYQFSYRSCWSSSRILCISSLLSSKSKMS